MDKTIYSDSNIGKRLDKIKKKESRCLWFKGEEIPLVSRITIGRDYSNSVVLDDRMVSRFHAIIQKIKNDYFVKDLNSSNGTYVNNKQVPKDKYVKLKENDMIRIGKYELTIA